MTADVGDKDGQDFLNLNQSALFVALAENPLYRQKAEKSIMLVPIPNDSTPNLRNIGDSMTRFEITRTEITLQ